ncbi:hypothetical protein LSPCS325_28550 [Lysinibacillus sp. CTST325]
MHYYTKPIPYQANLFKIEETADGTLIFNYFGESQSIANSPTRDNLIKSDGKVSKVSDQFTLPDSQYTDATYYGEFEFDLDKITKEKKQTWEELLQQMTLIWERKRGTDLY